VRGARNYGAVKSGGYDSKREHRRATQLALEEKVGAIRDLRTQVKMEIIPKQGGERAAHYVADFVYFDVAAGEEVIEDCKGFRSDVYRIKRKLVLLRYGKKIRET
jgi:hypothetical protein